MAQNEFEYRCKDDTGLALGDGSHIVFACWNAVDEDSPTPLAELLRYLRDRTCSGKLSYELEEAVRTVVASTDWRSQSMTAVKELYYREKIGEQKGFTRGEAKGFERGFVRGEAEGYERGQAQGFERGEAQGFERGQAQGRQAQRDEVSQLAEQGRFLDALALSGLALPDDVMALLKTIESQ